MENNILLTQKSPYKIDFENINDVCDRESENFVCYHSNKSRPNNRYGLPLVSEENFQEFYPLWQASKDEMDFQYYTEYLEKMPTLLNFLNKFKGGVGRTHILRIGPGGFFPPHRDGPNIDPFKETFRLFFTIKNCGAKNFAFIVDGQQLHLENSNIYYISTFKQHAAFCYGPDDVLCIVANIQICMANIKVLAEMLA